ncbi:DUF3110 domain-containing protein [Leptolyngbya sp. AN02str]|uniref:DUF3110 domain-containing protein n=1 Tax=Leptolyngbya sp. AN02str TaxID=3423363 RepID=UPI003D318851
MRVYVLLYNAGTDNEGIYTLRLKQDDEQSTGTYRNIILMFESEEDALRYSLMLEAQDFASPAVECLEQEEVEEFCNEADYDSVLVPEGTLTLPPETNLEVTDWQPDMERSPTEVLGRDDEAPTFSADELEQLRRRLEGLL